MTNAKLSSSLLEARAAQLEATLARHASAASQDIVGIGDNGIGPAANGADDRNAAAAAASGRRRFHPSANLGLRTSWVAAAAAVGFFAFTHDGGRPDPAIAPRSAPAASATPDRAPAPRGSVTLSSAPADAGEGRARSAAARAASGPATEVPASAVAVAPALAANTAAPRPSLTLAAEPLAAASGVAAVAAATAELSLASLTAGAPVTATTSPAATAAGDGSATPAKEPGLSPDAILSLVARGDALFSTRDIASARLFYERAADEGDAQAALRLGETYDANFLAQAHMSGVLGDAAAAAKWYRRARDLGSGEADLLLSGAVGHRQPQR